MALQFSETNLANKIWRMNNLYHIRDKNKSIILFKPNGIQNQLLEYRERKDFENIRDVVLKARQLGISTFSIIYLFDDVLFNQNYNAGIVAHKEEAVKGLFRIIHIAWKYFPKELKKLWRLETESKTEYAFNTNSRIKVALSFRSETLNALHISELAKISRQFPLRAEEIITGSIPAVTPTGNITIESTAEGNFGYFYDYYMEAHDRGYKQWFFPWHTEKGYQLAVPDNFKISDLSTLYNINFQNLQEKYNLTNEQTYFYYQKTKELKRLVLQEMPSCPEDAFVQSGNPVFDMSHVLRCDQSKPKAERVYVAGLDPAGVMGSDYHAFTILEYPSGKQVFALREKNDIDLLAKKVVSLCLEYDNALLNIERNGVGLALVNEIKKIYHNLYMSQRGYDKLTGRRDKAIGTSVTRSNKPLFISMLESALRNKEILISDDKTWHELSIFQSNIDGTLSAPPGAHDDMVMALALAKLAYDDVHTQITVKTKSKSFVTKRNSVFEQLDI